MVAVVGFPTILNEGQCGSLIIVERLPWYESWVELEIDCEKILPGKDSASRISIALVHRGIVAVWISRCVAQL